jgi:small subunit ribosomal protein S2
MAIEFTLRDLLEAGVHFGHQAHRWNPKMKRYIHGVRNRVHILDLTQTVPMLYNALVAVRDSVANGGRVLFVGTKRQASEVVATSAAKCAQYYVNHRWLGGMLTNWKTISNSIQHLATLEAEIADTSKGFTKKELLQMNRDYEKMNRVLGGIRDMGGLPTIMFILDTNKEAIAIKEARRLGITVIGIVDTNSDPDSVDFAIPGNDDAVRAIQLYCDLVASAVIDGIQISQGGSSVDLGAAINPSLDLPDDETLSA